MVMIEVDLWSFSDLSYDAIEDASGLYYSARQGLAFSQTRHKIEHIFLQ